MSRRWFAAFAMFWVTAQLIATARQVPAWRSEPSLWLHAAIQAPLKPRPLVNYARALILTGRHEDAERLLYLALASTDQPHIPAYDRADALMAVQANLQTLGIMRTVSALPLE